MLTGSSPRLRPLKRNDTGAHKPSLSGWRLTLARSAKNAFGWANSSCDSRAPAPPPLRRHPERSERSVFLFSIFQFQFLALKERILPVSIWGGVEKIEACADEKS